MASQNRPASRTTAEFLYDSVSSGANSGAVVALFFLASDLLNGHALFTPSLMGSVLFTGASAASVSGVRLDMVAYYSIVHFATFGALGAGISFLVHEVELHSRHPVLLLALSFGIFEVGFALAATLLMPGVIARLGMLEVALANLLAAGTMALFLLATHRPGLLQRLRHAQFRS